MTLLSDWKAHEKELEDYLGGMLKNNLKPPKDVVALLKTADLKAALKLADDSHAKNDIDGARKAQAKTQKFFFMYANQYKSAKVAAQADMAFSDLSDTLNMFNVYMTRTQTAVARLTDAMIQQAKTEAKNTAKVQELNIKSALSPLKFMYDWKAAKQDFEKETGVKKPSAKIMGEFRKSAGLVKSMEKMDKACQKADPAAYRKAYDEYAIAHANYASVLEKALASDKAADPIYKKKCGGLKEVLNSIDSRAAEKIKLLDNLGV